MKKRRIRYSELGAPRVSTPVELARALAAARAAEAAAARPDAAPAVIPSAIEEAFPARPSTPIAATAELLLFTVGAERFAVPIGDVDEAVDLPSIHFVPEMPASMLGVISLRGALVPIYSPAAALGQALLSRRAALIFRLGSKAVGVAVDDVEDALLIGESDLRDLPVTDRDELVQGVVHHEGHIISVMRAAGLVDACRGTRVLTTS